MNRKECIEKINSLIPCESVRNCIFRNDNVEFEDEFLCDKKSILVYFSNVINIAFLYIYAHYCKWKEVDNKIDSNTANNFVRVFSELDKIYKDSNLSFDIIENLLLDVQLDIAINGQLSRELRLTNKIIKNENFSKHAYIAKKSRTSYRLNDTFDLAQLYDDLIDLISTFPFLRDLSFTMVQMEYAYYIDERTNEKKDIQNLYNIVLQYDNHFSRDEEDYDVDLSSNYTLIMRNNTFYFLERIESTEDENGDHELFLSYWQVGMFNNAIHICVSSGDKIQLESYRDTVIIQYDTAYEDYFYSIFSFDYVQGGEEEGFRIKNFYNINYKYIKNLALSISDVLSENSRHSIFSVYGKKHNFKYDHEGVQLLQESKELFYTWSEIISLLMIEEGTANILAYLIKSDRDILKRLLSNLEFRFGKNLFDQNVVIKNIEDTIQSFDKQAEIKNEINESNKQVYNREMSDFHSEIIANKLVYYISKAVNGNEIDEFQLNFPVSVRSKILLLEEIKNSDLDFEVKLKSIKSIVFNTIKTLYCFYIGFFAYAAIKKDFDNESFFHSLTGREIAAYQRQANHAFSKAVSKCFDEIDTIDQKDPLVIIAIFKKFCVSLESSISHNEQLQLLKSYLGRNKIIDVKMLDELASNIQCNTDEEDLEILVANIKKMFNYLRTGQSRKSSSTLGIIFPYVATCEFTDVNRDGNIIYHFSIINVKGQEKILRVLSEFKYHLNKKYYFLPNKLSSDERLNLWIEPIIISFENFEKEKRQDIE